MKKKEGFLLIGVLCILLLLLLIVPVMVNWIQNDTKMSVKDQKSSLAFSLAEAAIDRGYWKVKSSSATFYLASVGAVMSGYNFDVTYNDIPGGSYRIQVASGPGDSQVTVYGEGRDSLNKEIRSIKAIYTNTDVPAAILSGGDISMDGQSTVHWGPVMTKGNITLTNAAITTYYPRKLAAGVVFPRDPNGTTVPPNYTSPHETSDWESAYNVPDMPDFDFAAMRSSAAQTGTMGCQDVDVKAIPAPASAVKSCSGTGCATTSKTNCYYVSGTSPYINIGIACSTKTNCNCTAMQCCKSTTYGGTITCPYTNDFTAQPYGCSTCTLSNMYLQYSILNGTNRVDGGLVSYPNGTTLLRDQDYTWYWGENRVTGVGSITWLGYNGVKGTIIAENDLNIPTLPANAYDDRYCRVGQNVDNNNTASPGCTVAVPPKAYREYQSLLGSTSDCPYRLSDCPAIPSRTSNSATYLLNSVSGGDMSGGDLGVYGFVYVGRNFTRDGPTDIYGAIWSSSNTQGSGDTVVFYNSKLNVPTINVVLTRDSWQEKTPSPAAWH